jgi:hypothetical protein
MSKDRENFPTSFKAASTRVDSPVMLGVELNAGAGQWLMPGA